MRIWHGRNIRRVAREVSEMHCGVEDGYDRWSVAYDTFENPMVALARLAFDALAPDPTGETVVDLGCGTGQLLRRLLERGAARAVGVDVSVGMLARAQSCLAGYGPRVLLVRDALCGDWLSAPSAGGWIPADAACISLVLEHFPTADAVLERASRAVRPGGWLFVAEMHAELAAVGTGAHFMVDGVRHDLPSYAHTAVELRAALDGAGFEVTRELEMGADDYADRIPKLLRHTTRHALYSCLARRAARRPVLQGGQAVAERRAPGSRS